MSARYTQSKSEAAKHSEILKAMLKRPENKLCADCKRNDPRWASTNLGCFMCIRCSGIHRGMGVHITRIKSVDLDTWSPEQIVNVQRWGNRRANAYWEAHLKPGHMPPEHKMESFIRSKYETKRWAMEGPMPEPETLDGDDSTDEPVDATATSTPAASTSRSSSTVAPPRKSTAVDLLAGPPRSAATSAPAPVAALKAGPPPIAAVKGDGGGLFDLDFNAAAPTPTVPAPKKDAKADILSLFASAPSISQQQQQQQQVQQHARQSSFGMGGLSLGNGGVDPWGASKQQQQYPAPMTAAQHGGGWGGFDAFASAPSASGSRTAHSSVVTSTDVWGSSTAGGGNNSGGDPFGDFSSGSANGGAKKADAFSDIWA